MVSNTDRSPEVETFLDQLGAALADVPSSAARDVHQGIAEELTSLPPLEAHERIQQLGDPSAIAAQVRAEVGSTRFGAGLRSRAYVISASLAVAVGGLILPLVGWLVGYALVCLSPAWRRWEKAVTLSLPLGVALLVAIYITVSGIGSRTLPSELSGLPMLPISSLAIFNAAFAFMLTNLAVGLWLLIRAFRRP
jgi:hypothetical protein